MPITKDDIIEMHSDGYSRKVVDMTKLKDELVTFYKYLIHHQNQARAQEDYDKLTTVMSIRETFYDLFFEVINND